MRATRPILIEARYRSRLELKIADQLEREGIAFEYESVKIPYTVPERQARYLPDFKVGPVFLEAKGYFRTTSERQKLLHVRESNPGIDVRLVFQDANKKIYKGSPTSYRQWAEDKGFLWCDKGTVPREWIEEIRALKNGSGQKLKSKMAAAGTGQQVRVQKATAGSSTKQKCVGGPTESRGN